MDTEDATTRPRIYDRAFLLSPAKRNQVMALWEIQQYGVDSFADANYVHLYGMSPTEWYRRGIRLLARTTVECVRDALGDLIGADVARVIQGAPDGTRFVAIDPFAGSCNSLYWILRHARGIATRGIATRGIATRGIAFELDQAIVALTQRNISHLDTPIELIHDDYQAHAYQFAADHRLIVFVAPPWGDALNEVTGLDLRRTQPPIADIVDYFESHSSGHPILYIIQVHQHLDPDSLADVTRRFDASELRIYDINVEGMKHGALLGRCRWRS